MDPIPNIAQYPGCPKEVASSIFPCSPSSATHLFYQLRSGRGIFHSSLLLVPDSQLVTKFCPSCLLNISDVPTHLQPPFIDISWGS